MNRNNYIIILLITETIFCNAATIRGKADVAAPRFAGPRPDSLKKTEPA
jgi:hypothetical protein